MCDGMSNFTKMRFVCSLLILASANLCAQQAGLRYPPKVKPVLQHFLLHEPIIRTEQTNPIPPKTPLPAAWRYHDLAFFCKIEVKMEKAAKFPVKFRLGDVQYVDRLEGKRPFHY